MHTAGSLDDLLARWTHNPHPELAAAIQRVGDALPATLPVDPPLQAWKDPDARARGELLAKLESRRWKQALPQLEAMLDWPRDPRTVDVLLRWIAQPPFRSHPSRTAWDLIGRLLVQARDPRVFHALPTDWRAFEALFPRWDTGRHVRHVLEALREVVPAAPLAPTEIEALQALDGPARGVDIESLFAAVWADPSDVAVRQVLADALIQTGDTRGEFIALQLRTKLDAAQRKRAKTLLSANKMQWLGALGPVMYASGVAFERGFCTKGWLVGGARADVLKGLIGHPAWSTLTHLDVRGDGHHYAEILTHPVLHGLLELTRVSASALHAHTTPAPRMLRRLLLHAPVRELVLPTGLERGFPELETLGLWWSSARPPWQDDLVALTQTPLWARLKRLEIQQSSQYAGQTVRWLRASLARVETPECLVVRCSDGHRFACGFDFEAERVGTSWKVAARYVHRKGRDDRFAELLPLVRSLPGVQWTLTHPRYTPDPAELSSLMSAGVS